MGAINDEYIETFNAVRCNYCLNKLQKGCKAFKKIPAAIISGANHHDKPLPSQKGYNTFIFKPEDTDRYRSVKDILDAQK